MNSVNSKQTKHTKETSGLQQSIRTKMNNVTLGTRRLNSSTSFVMWRCKNQGLHMSIDPHKDAVGADGFNNSPASGSFGIFHM